MNILPTPINTLQHSRACQTIDVVWEQTSKTDDPPTKASKGPKLEGLESKLNDLDITSVEDKKKATTEPPKTAVAGASTTKTETTDTTNPSKAKNEEVICVKGISFLLMKS